MRQLDTLSIHPVFTLLVVLTSVFPVLLVQQDTAAAAAAACEPHLQEPGSLEGTALE
jgi:hypothetical protein